MEQVTVSSEGQIALPRKFVTALNLAEGFDAHVGSPWARNRAVEGNQMKSLQGVAGGLDLMKAFEAFRRGRSASVKTRVLDSWAILEWMSGNSQPVDAIVAPMLFVEAEAGF